MVCAQPLAPGILGPRTSLPVEGVPEHLLFGMRRPRPVKQDVAWLWVAGGSQRPAPSVLPSCDIGAKLGGGGGGGWGE